MAYSDYPMVPRQGNVTIYTGSSTNNRKPGKDYSTHRLLIGTHTSGADQNYLQIADVQLPIASTELANFDDDRGGTCSKCTRAN
jgi:Histone-binding protein RBBP4 or subunit C of CAF1 complex